MGDDKLRSGNVPTVDREINGTQYHVSRLGWWAMGDGIKLLEEVLGGSIRDLLDSKGGVDSILSSTGAGAALTGFASRCFGPEGKKLLLLMGSQTMFEDGDRHVFLTEPVMDVWFAQHPDHAIPWLLFALEAQYADFRAIDRRSEAALSRGNRGPDGGDQNNDGAIPVGARIPDHLREDWPLLRLLTDERVNLDPARAGEIPATFVLSLNDALDVCDEAIRIAHEKAAAK